MQKAIFLTTGRIYKKWSLIGSKLHGHDKMMSIVLYSISLQVFKSSCSMDLTYYPYDTQTCKLEFVAWSYTKDEVGQMIRIVVRKPVFGVYDQVSHKPSCTATDDWGALYLNSRASDYGARGQGFETYIRCVVSLIKTLFSPKVLVIPRKRWLHPNMTE